MPTSHSALAFRVINNDQMLHGQFPSDVLCFNQPESQGFAVAYNPVVFFFFLFYSLLFGWYVTR